MPSGFVELMCHWTDRPSMDSSSDDDTVAYDVYEGDAFRRFKKKLKPSKGFLGIWFQLNIDW